MDETGVYVFGAVSGALPGQTYAGGPDDVFLRKYDPAGHELWTRQFGTAGDDFPMAGPVAIDDTGVYVAGWTNGTLPGEANTGTHDEDEVVAPRRGVGEEGGPYRPRDAFQGPRERRRKWDAVPIRSVTPPSRKGD
jgi:hypothetical protein